MRRCAAAAAVLGLAVRLAAAPGVAGVLLPYPSDAHRNPALLFIEEPGLEPARSRSLPIGLAGLFFDRANVLLYVLDKERFAAEFDLYVFLEQAASPDTLLLNPATSPEEIVFDVSADRIRLRDGHGRALAFRAEAGWGGPSVAGTALIPPPLASWAVRCGSVVLETGAFWGGTVYDVAPNKALDRALDGDRVLADTLYQLEASAAVRAGVSQAASVGGPVARLGSHELVASVRLLAYYAAAMIEVDASSGMTTDGAGVPSGVGSDYELFYFYPGTGLGVGARLDAGLVLPLGRYAVGASVLNLLGADIAHGRCGSLDSSSHRPETRASFGSVPSLAVHASRHGRLAGGDLVLAADAGWGPGPRAHAGALWSARRARIGAGAAWEGNLRLDCAAGVLLPPVWLDIGANARTTTLSSSLVYGLSLAVGREVRR